MTERCAAARRPAIGVVLHAACPQGRAQNTVTTTLAPMRRWLAILLLVFLPIQFSWAAVASYCGHETGAAAGHIGHHDHAGHGHAKQDADPGHPGKADGKSAGASSIDCGHCHGYCAGMVAIVAPLAAQSLASVPPSLGDTPRAEHLPAQPERPQWAALA